MISKKNLLLVFAPRYLLSDIPYVRSLIDKHGYSGGLLITDYGKSIDKGNHTINIAMLDPGFIAAIEDRPRIIVSHLSWIYYITTMAVFTLANINRILVKTSPHGIHDVNIAYLYNSGTDADGKLIMPCYPILDFYDANINLTSYELKKLDSEPLSATLHFLRQQYIAGNGYDLFKRFGYSLPNLLKGICINRDLYKAL